MPCLWCWTDLRPGILAWLSLSLVDRNNSALHQLCVYIWKILFLIPHLSPSLLLTGLFHRLQLSPPHPLHITFSEDIFIDYDFYLFYVLYHQCKSSESFLIFPPHRHHHQPSQWWLARIPQCPCWSEKMRTPSGAAPRSAGWLRNGTVVTVWLSQSSPQPHIMESS